MPFERVDVDKAAPPGTALVRLTPWLAALAALALGMAVSLQLERGEQARAQGEHQRLFDEAAADIGAALASQLADSERLIRTFQSVFIASESVTQDEFVRVYDNLTSDRARINLQALAYAERVRDGSGERYLTNLFAPVAGNEAIRGLDVARQASNMAALQVSRDSNQVHMSAPFKLMQSGTAGPAVDGFILRLPVYDSGSNPRTVEERRRLLIGSLGASFRLRDLIGGVMPANGGLIASVEIHDVTDGVPRLLHAHRIAGAQEGLRRQEAIRFGGRVWSVNVAGSPLVATGPWWARTFWLGSLASLFLAALVWSLVSTRQRAVALGKAMSERARASEERFRKLTELLPSLVLVARRGDGELVYLNAAARNRLGDQPGRRGLEEYFNHGAWQHLVGPSAPGVHSGDLQMRPRYGDAFWASVYVSPIDIDEVPMWLIVASDVSEQRRLTERLSYQASHDSLTRLLNRREFEAQVAAQLGERGEHGGALLFVDLDQFKLINDTSGHRAGDELLVQLAALMRERLRPDDIIGRLGGDEFGVLLRGLRTTEGASHAAERLRRSVEGYSFSWEQRIYNTSASIGAVMLEDTGSIKELFARADAACYLAKEGGRNRVHFYSEDDASVATRLGEMEWASRLRQAIRDGRLLLDFQELRAIQAGVAQRPHAELLLRLRAEDGREVMPGAFLPAAERYGLMPVIDRWVVETAIRNIDRLHPSGAGLETCAINLSSASLEDSGLVDFIEDMVRACGVDPARLMFEITETVAMRDFAASSALIARLRHLGCRVALDDFGAGMSSFGYMKNLELDMVKVDGSFVQELATDRMSQSIVRAVTEIGHQQGLQVVAEWVSSPDMVELLRAMGVDYAQGYAIHSPERVVFQRSPG